MFLCDMNTSQMVKRIKLALESLKSVAKYSRKKRNGELSNELIVSVIRIDFKPTTK